MKKQMFILSAIIFLIGCAVPERPQENFTIEIFIDENQETIAKIIFMNGSPDLQFYEEGYQGIQELKNDFEEIISEKTLPLEVERYVKGNYVLGEIQVTKTSEEYPYALQQALFEYGYLSEVKTN